MCLGGHFAGLRRGRAEAVEVQANKPASTIIETTTVLRTIPPSKTTISVQYRRHRLATLRPVKRATAKRERIRFDFSTRRQQPIARLIDRVNLIGRRVFVGLLRVPRDPRHRTITLNRLTSRQARHPPNSGCSYRSAPYEATYRCSSSQLRHTVHVLVAQGRGNPEAQSFPMREPHPPTCSGSIHRHPPHQIPVGRQANTSAFHHTRSQRFLPTGSPREAQSLLVSSTPELPRRPRSSASAQADTARACDGVRRRSPVRQPARSQPSGSGIQSGVS